MKFVVAVLSSVVIACGAGNRAGVTHAGPLRILVIGDSVAHGAGDESGRGIAGALSQNLSHAAVANYGINGARTIDVLRAMTSFPIETADVIVMSIGGNDLYGDSLARLASVLWPEHAMRRTVARVGAIVSRIHTRNASARVLLLGLYDPYRPNTFLDRAVNQWDALLISHFAADPAVTVIRITDLLRDAKRLSPIDHFHPSAAGYALIAARIAPAL